MSAGQLVPRPLRRGALAAALALCIVTPAHAAPDARAARLYEDALVRFERQDHKGAIIQLKNALQIDRRMLPVQVLLGRALLADGQVAAAEVAFLEALDLGVNRAEIVLPMIEAALLQGQHRKVLDESRFAAAGLPRPLQAQVHLQHATAAADLGEPRQALKLIEQARAIDASSPDSWLAEATVLLRVRQFDRAAAAVDKAMERAPGSAVVLHHVAQLRHLQGDLKGALDAYDRTLAVQPAHVESLVARAGLLIDLDRGSDAQATLARLREAAPDDPREAYLSALLAERAGKTDEARAALKRVTALIDPVPIAYIRYRPQMLMLNGLAHVGLGEREAAKPYLEAYQRLDPGGGASKLLAQVLLAEGKFELAIEALEAYLRAHPADAQAQALLTSAHMATGRPARAQAVARDALQRRDAPELRAALGLSLLQSGRAGDALAELESAYRADPAQTRAGAALVGLYLQAGQSKKAMSVAQALVKREPRRASLHMLLGQARQHTGDRAGARAAFEQAGQLDPAAHGPAVLLARLDAQDGKPEAAVRRLEARLARSGDELELMLELASHLEQQGRTADAQRWLDKAVAGAGSRETRPLLALVDLHLRHGQSDKALEAAKAASAKTPGELAPYLALARAQLRHGDADGARLALTTATRLADYNAPLQLEIALLQLLAGHVSGAAYSLDKALSSQPDYLPAQAAQVDVEIRQGALPKALARAQQIAAQHPKAAIGPLLIGDVAWARGDVGAAGIAYRRAHQIEPGTQTMLKVHQVVLHTEGAPAALAHVEAWLRKYPRDDRAAALAADLQARTGRLAAAARSYEALIARRPRDAELLNNLANVQLLQGQPAQAVATAERALAQAPGNGAVIDTLGWSMLANGQTERALQLLRDARLRLPGNPTVRYHLAAALAKTGRHAEAREELTQALASTPRFEGSDEARALLQSLP